MDWNWFFSALAQSTAAIVGIFAAFIITKIINNQNSFMQKQREVARLLLDSRNRKAQADIHLFKWYNDRMRELEFGRLMDLLRTPERDIPTANRRMETWREKSQCSPYDDQIEIRDMIEAMTQALEEREEAEPGRIIAERNSAIKERVIVPARASRDEHREISEVAKQKEKLDSFRVEVQSHVERVGQFVEENSSYPESSPLVTQSILVTISLFYVGVIYPLSFLTLDLSQPVHISIGAFFSLLFSFHGLLLALVSAIFTILMVGFMRINMRLKLGKDKLEELKNWTSYSTYSEYLANFFSYREDA